MMEKKLRQLFDFQKFSGNKRLAEMIEATEKCYGKALSDDDLQQVNAAGEFVLQKSREDNSDD